MGTQERKKEKKGKEFPILGLLLPNMWALGCSYPPSGFKALFWTVFEARAVCRHAGRGGLQVREEKLQKLCFLFPPM